MATLPALSAVTAPASSAPVPVADPLAADRQRLLALGVESAGVRAALIEPVDGRHRIVGWINVARGRELAMPMQVAETVRRLGQRLGCALWDEEQNEPFARAIAPIRYPPIQHVATVASTRPRVRVVVAALSYGQSLQAACRAVTCAPGAIVGEFVLGPDGDGSGLAQIVAQQNPELLVIAGGNDPLGPGAESSLLALLRAVASALSRQVSGQRPGVIFAGSYDMAERAGAIVRALDAQLHFEAVANVLPAPGSLRPQGVAAAVTYAYWRLNQRIVGFKELMRWVTPPGQLTTWELSFTQLVQAWRMHMALPVLHGLYCTGGWWLHVLAGREQAAVQVRFVEPGQLPFDHAQWPPLQLVVGPWPQQWPRPQRFWWDRSGMAPMIAGLGQVNPLAMVQVLETDLFETA